MLANLNDVLKPARAGKYGVGSFNTIGYEMLRGVIEAAEETNSPLIIGPAEILLPYGSLEDVASFMIPMAERAKVPVVVHLDHGLSPDVVKKALELGFSSVMYDCSTESYESNRDKVKEMATLAHSYGATIEAELGHVGQNANAVEASGILSDPSAFYTEVSEARDYVNDTGVDALAIAVGSAHGLYKLPPKLDFERIRDIAAETDASLVLHGGSGISDDGFKQAIQEGISKVNIFTDLNIAGANAIGGIYKEGTAMTDLSLPISEAVKQETIKKMKLFGSIGKA